MDRRSGLLTASESREASQDQRDGCPTRARHSNPARRFPFDGFWRFESQFCAPPASSGRVGVLDRWPLDTLLIMLCQRCHEREAKVYLVMPDSTPSAAEEQHLCEPCFEQSLQQQPEVLQQLRNAETEAKPIAGMPHGWTSYMSDPHADD